MGTSVYSRLAVIGVLAAALALGACGRKGPLELPPSANSTAAAPQQQGPSLGQEEPPAGFEDARNQDLAAPQPNKKSFILDPLLSNDTPARKSRSAQPVH